MSWRSPARLAFLIACGVAASAAIDVAFGGTLTVGNTQDGGVDGSGHLSLRQAIQNAQPGDTIVFDIPTTDPNYDVSSRAWTIKVGGEIAIASDVTIDAGNLRVVISGQNQTRIFDISAGTVNLRNLTIGDSKLTSSAPRGAFGGAIYNAGALTVVGCTFTNNEVGSGGGAAIYNAAGASLVATNCTLVGNRITPTSGGSGGSAILNDGTLSLSSCTIYSNLTSSAVINSGPATAAHVQNTVIAFSRHPATGDYLFDVSGSFTSGGYNFISSQDSATSGFGGANSHDQVGGKYGFSAILDPKLGPLQDNDGPAATCLPQSGSPLTDQGNSFGVPTDQRGFKRPARYIPASSVGDAADIGAAELDPPQGGLTIRVTTTDEHDDATCGESDCTLIEALNLANASAKAAKIIFNPGVTGTITTNRVTPNGLTIINAVTIAGPGARSLTISGENAARAFQVLNVGNNKFVNISGLTIANGFSTSDGAGVYNTGSSIELDDCMLLNNNGDAKTGNSRGGAIFNDTSGSLTLQRCTLTNNHSPHGGGGLRSLGLSILVNCTVTSNSANFGGGGLFNDQGLMTVQNCTVAGNVAGSLDGGGIVNVGGTADVVNSIFAGNSSAVGGPDCSGTFSSAGHNLLTNATGQSGFGGNSDQLNVPDPKLDTAVKNNGGPTDTLALLAGSPAIDNGGDNSATLTDQRLFARVGAADIGAFEFGASDPLQSGNTRTVTTTDEHNDGTCTVGDCTLLEAILDVDDASNAAVTSINFAPGLSGTITTNNLTPDGLPVQQPVTINGPGARLLTITASGAGRAFNATSSLDLHDLTIADCKSGKGAAIYAQSSLAIVRCTLRHNFASGDSGGAVYCASTCFSSIAGSTFYNNQSDTGSGGAIYSAGGVAANTSTFDRNQAWIGGGIASNGGTIDLIRCTITENSTTSPFGTAGGIYNATNTSARLADTIVANNTTGSDNSVTAADVTGQFTSRGYNIIGTGGSGFVNGVNNDEAGTASAPLDAKIDPNGAQNNGGPTDTVALFAGSPAIDAGSAFGFTKDQRGFPPIGKVDIGAFEYGSMPPVNPTATTEPPTNVTPTSATLHARVNPEGFAATVQFVYGPTIYATADAGTGTTEREVSADISGLTPGATYTYAAYAITDAGTSESGGDVTFTTPTSNATPPAQLQNLSTRKQVGTGDNLLIGGFIITGTDDKNVLLRGLGPSLPVNGALADPTLELHDTNTTLATDDNWKDKQADQISATGIPPSSDLEAAIVATLHAKAAADGGAAYTGILAGNNGGTGIGLLEIYDLNSAANSQLANISTRGFVGTGDDLLIGGFIPGPGDRASLKVLVRALGPSLAGQGVGGALLDPLLELHDGNGNALLTNDNWKDSPNAAEIQASLPPPDDHESAIITTLAPATTGYTAVVRGVNGSTGVALVEVYALP